MKDARQQRLVEAMGAQSFEIICAGPSAAPRLLAENGLRVGIVPPRSTRLLVPGTGAEDPIALPEGWSAKVLLLSGVSPEVPHAAAFCKAARAARRRGTTVFIDLNARWDLWRGRDARAIRMVLREADVLWLDAEDLVGLNMDLPSLAGALRPRCVVAMNDGSGRARAFGPFGEIASRDEIALPPTGGREHFTAAIAAELARAREACDRSPDPWARALTRAHRAAARSRH